MKRAGTVEFVSDADNVPARVTFDAESENAVEQQRQGWQAILNNFARHVESRQQIANVDEGSDGERVSISCSGTPLRAPTLAREKFSDLTRRVARTDPLKLQTIFLAGLQATSTALDATTATGPSAITEKPLSGWIWRLGDGLGRVLSGAGRFLVPSAGVRRQPSIWSTR